MPQNLDSIDEPEDLVRKAYVDNLIEVSATQPTGSEIWVDLSSGAGGNLLDKGTADSYYVNTDGDTMQGNLSLDNTGFLTLNGPTVTSQNIEFKVADALRWTLGRDNTSEAGANSGTNFAVSAWDDAGGFITRALTILRNSGLITVAGDPTADLGIATKQYVDARVFYGTRNRIINGDFSVNQRGFTTTTTNGAYGFDRWLSAFVGGTVTYSTVTPAMGELPESARSHARVTPASQAAVSDYAILAQRIESVRTLAGKTATISFWAKAASGTPKVAVELSQNFGTGGTPSTQVDTYVGQVTLSGSWARYSITIGVPSVAGKTLGTSGTDHLGLALWVSGGSNYNARTGSLGIQNIAIDFWGVQVEEGTYASPYEQKSYADELRACWRFYQRWYHNATDAPIGSYGVIYTATRALGSYVYPGGAMRVAPTVTFSPATAWEVVVGSAVLASTAVNTTIVQPTACQVEFTVAGGTVGHGWYARAATAGTQYIELNAEL